MGVCFSQSDKQGKIGPEDGGLKDECKVLLLGSEQSGKSTIVKHMQLIHQGGFTEDQLEWYTPIIYRNVVDCARSVVVHMRKIGIDCKESDNRVLMENILDYNPEPRGLSVVQFTAEMAQTIHQFLQDPFVLKVVEDHKGELYPTDSAGYFLNNVLRIGSLGYVPSEADVLHAHQKSAGITETHFTRGQLSIHICDIGRQRSERRKWIRCFESVESIIFCVALSEYDQDLSECKSQNQMQKSLELFESIINSPWFIRTAIILLLNKLDVFKTKLAKVPLAKVFEEYTGGNDVNKAAKYILRKYMQTNRARRSIYTHLTQATDPMNIRLVFAAVNDIILQNSLKGFDRL